jgi:uncharacterized protein YecE (DUF72 family)
MRCSDGVLRSQRCALVIGSSPLTPIVRVFLRVGRDIGFRVVTHNNLLNSFSKRSWPFDGSGFRSMEPRNSDIGCVVSLRRLQAEGEIDLPIIATAAWSIPKKVAHGFAKEGSGLTRYASIFDGVEINSTFYRRHKTSTFARWAESVPDSFRFAVKIPKEMTHTRAMKAELFNTFLEDIAPLGQKRGPLLCQLPPSLAFDADMFETAFKTMRNADDGPIVIEVRHRSWASAEALDLLKTFAIDRVLADPAPVWPVEDFDGPSRYVRLHGKPKIYYSGYTGDEIRLFSELLASDGWCVFDNTASGAAIENALSMLEIC